MSLTYQVNVAQLGKLTEGEFALSLLRYQQMVQAFPPAAPVQQVFAPSAASVNNAKEHPLAAFYKQKTKEGKASVSAFDAERFTRTKSDDGKIIPGYMVQKGIETPLQVKITVWKGRLLERGLATLEEIQNVLDASEGATYQEEQEETQVMEAGSAEKGMELL